MMDGWDSTQYLACSLYCEI